MDKSNKQIKPLSNTVVIISLALLVIMVILPLVTIPDSEFGGTDGQGSEVVAEIAPDYDSAWIGNIWEPPGTETEGLLFALQAAAGALFIGYVLGYLRGRSEKRYPQKERPDASGAD